MNHNDVLLTDKERRKAILDESGGIVVSRRPNQEKAIAQAQIKKVVEWGSVACGEHWQYLKRKRFECYPCRQALRKLAGLE